MDYKPTPTVCSSDKFEIKEDSHAVREAMKGPGTKQMVIINILTVISNEQRQLLEFTYNATYNRDLFKDLKKELNGRLKDVIKGLMLTPIDYLCKRMHDALKYVSLNKAENVVIEVLFTRSNEEIAQIVTRYEECYGCSLAEHIRTLTFTDDFRPFLIFLLSGVRDSPGTVDAVKATKQAEELFAVGKGKLHPKQEVFYHLLVRCSFAQLRLVFAAYRDVSGHSVHEDIKRGMSQFKDIMLSIATVNFVVLLSSS